MLIPIVLSVLRDMYRYIIKNELILVLQRVMPYSFHKSNFVDNRTGVHMVLCICNCYSFQYFDLNA